MLEARRETPPSPSVSQLYCCWLFVLDAFLYAAGRVFISFSQQGFNSGRLLWGSAAAMEQPVIEVSINKTLKGCHQTKKLLKVLMHNTSSALQVNKHTEGDRTTSSAANSMLIWLLLSFSISSRRSPRRAGPSCRRFCSHGVKVVFVLTRELLAGVSSTPWRADLDCCTMGCTAGSEPAIKLLPRSPLRAATADEARERQLPAADGRFTGWRLG